MICFSKTMSRFLFALLATSALLPAQVFQFTREQLIEYTPKNPYERSADGRPKVPDRMLKKFEGQPLTGYPDTPSHPGSPLWHGARWVLRREGQPMRTPDIAKRLQELGWKFTSKAPSESLRTILLRKADIFERIPGGKFQLKGS